MKKETTNHVFVPIRLVSILISVQQTADSVNIYSGQKIDAEDSRNILITSVNLTSPFVLYRHSMWLPKYSVDVNETK